MHPHSIEPLRTRARYRDHAAGLLISVILVATFAAVDCSPRRSFAPLQGKDSGLVALRWGSRPEAGLHHMIGMPGVQFLDDTVFIPEYGLVYHKPDSVFAPDSSFSDWRRIRFVGGTFFDYPVDLWELSYNEGEHLRSVSIVLLVEPSEGQAVMKSIGSQFARLYGTPQWVGKYQRGFQSGGWAERTQDGARPTTSVRVLLWSADAIASAKVSVSFRDQRWTDSLEASSYRKPRRLIHISQWDVAVKAVIGARKRQSPKP